MLELPKRITLAEQTAQSMRKAIKEGAWKDTLPGERRLSQILKVSRPTVRAAVQLLAQDGWLDLRRGRRSRHIKRAPAAKPAVANLVCFVTQVPAARWSEPVHQAYIEIRARLATEGFTTEVLVCEDSGTKAYQRKLEGYLRQNRVNCCALLSVKYDLQRWLTSLGMPALVVGSCDPSLKLPSYEVDSRSTCRHAAGVFLRLGHRRLALVVRNTLRGGDLASEQGFLEGAERGSRGVQAVVARHHDTAASVSEELNRLLAAKEPPTAFLVTTPCHAFTVLYQLQRRGLRIPEDASIISSFPDSYFKLVNPAISHYAFEGDVFATRLTRLTLKLVHAGRLPPAVKLIEQKFVPGATVGPAPAIQS